MPEIARYLLDNPTEYVFSSITTSIDGEVSFEPRASKGQERNVGSLVVPMTARFLINDGLHRRAAIEEALKENPQLGDETVSVVFFIDAGLGRSQQLFADLNVGPTCYGLKSQEFYLPLYLLWSQYFVDQDKTTDDFANRARSLTTTVMRVSAMRGRPPRMPGVISIYRSRAIAITFSWR